MNSDLYCMCTAILSVWNKSNIKKSYGIVVKNKNDDIYKVFSLLKNKFGNEIDFIFHIFNNSYSYLETTFYTTFLPSDNFIFAAKNKGVKKIVFLGSRHSNDYTDIVVEPFNYEFGKIIDLLSLYKSIKN